MNNDGMLEFRNEYIGDFKTSVINVSYDEFGFIVGRLNTEENGRYVFVRGYVDLTASSLRQIADKLDELNNVNTDKHSSVAGAAVTTDWPV